jgi:hypothetical protein
MAQTLLYAHMNIRKKKKTLKQLEYIYIFFLVIENEIFGKEIVF